MSTMIQASELVVGDLYCQHFSGGYGGRPGEVVVRQVTARRTVRTVETYEVLETLALDGTRRGEISLRADVTVERLDPAGSVGDLSSNLTHLPDGESLFVVYFGMRFYA